MPFSEIIRIALSSIGVNKLRSLLTMLGIAIGVFSVIGVMTAVTALRNSIESDLSFLGSNMFQFAKYPAMGGPDNGARRRLYALRRDITYRQAERYRELMADVTDVICLKAFTGGVQAVYNGRKTAPSLSLGGTDMNFIISNQYEIATGRNLSREDVEFVRPVVVIGQDLVSKLFPSEDPLGRQLRMGDRPYTVIGTLASKGSSFGQSQDETAIIPISRFLADFGSERRSINIATQAPSQQLYNDTVDKAITAMRIARELRPADPNDFELYSNDSMLAAFGQIADKFGKGSFVISAIALLAAGVGIMNIMLVSVTERTKEIGIRKSIGARRRSILFQFLIESLVISLVGGLIGIAMGLAVGNLLALAMKASFVVPWLWVGIGISVCGAIGVGFGFYPAFKAARLDPIEALRFE